MTEAEFGEILKEMLRESLPNDYTVSTKENLLYKVFVDENGAYTPRGPKELRRGNFAFQTDLLIKKNALPLLVLELKYGGFTTHDILTYSAKALKHKEVYPYLRYGLVLGDITRVTSKFFTHNTGFDFAMVMDDVAKKDATRFIREIEKQLRSAELLLKILTKDIVVKCFSQSIEVDNS